MIFMRDHFLKVAGSLVRCELPEDNKRHIGKMKRKGKISRKNSLELFTRVKSAEECQALDFAPRR
jgi:hypothetical protein